MHEKYKKEINLTDEKAEVGTYCLSTIISSGDAVGLVIILSEETQVSETDMRICQIAAKFLAKALEE